MFIPIVLFHFSMQMKFKKGFGFFKLVNLFIRFSENEDKSGGRLIVTLYVGYVVTKDNRKALSSTDLFIHCSF